MKKLITSLTLSILFFGLTQKTNAQNYLPIPTTGYNFDGIAENTPASATTNTILDGSTSGYVLNTVSYATAYNNTSSGLPNNGLITSGTRTYQLQSYTVSNVLMIYGSGNSGTLTVTTPAPYSVLSVLAIGTDAGSSTLVNATVLFTDNSTQVFNNLTLYDWYNGTPYIINNLGRVAVPGTGAISDVNSGNPRLYALDLTLTCANQTKSVQAVIIQNTATGPKTCLFALSGVNPPQSLYSETLNDVSCFGGSNGSIIVNPLGGTAPFSYTWSVPAPNSATLSGIPAGTYNYSVTDACGLSGYVSTPITISQPTSNVIEVVASQTDVCMGQQSATLTTSGAASYIWSGGAGVSYMAVVSPTITTTYSVTGTTSLGCTMYGNVTINVLPLPTMTISGLPNVLCTNSSEATLTAVPSGGIFSGTGVSNGIFSPAGLSLGFYNVLYTYTDNNGCTGSETTSVNILPAPGAALIVSPSTTLCITATANLVGTPSGGTFSGVAGITGNTLKASLAGVGTHTITYSKVNANNCTAVSTATLRVNACTGIEELKDENLKLSVYPNPNEGSFHIKSLANENLNIINGLGQIISVVKLDESNSHHVLIENLPSGVYFIQSANKEYRVQKVIVTK